MLRKTLIENYTMAGGERVFSYLAYDFGANEFMVLRGIRNGDDYAENKLTIQEFFSNATDLEKDSFRQFIEVMLGN